ncbi:MAG: hypothetical protein LBT53_09700 [Puniceicoccales bacterium]|nr:hypothetical protein [Puniceicoccales bacterium]
MSASRPHLGYYSLVARHPHRSPPTAHLPPAHSPPPTHPPPPPTHRPPPTAHHTTHYFLQ